MFADTEQTLGDIWRLADHGVTGRDNRRWRLFACACCRGMWPLLTDPRSREAVEVAERYADGAATLEELRQARVGAFYAAREGQSDAHRAAHYAAADEAFVTAEHVSWCATKEGYQKVQVDWLRDIFGRRPNPPVIRAAVRAWNGGTVLKLAQAVYQERAFDRLPVLADALEDAGCTDADILGHCRGGGEHVRGCWAVDAVLGRG
jgi:hypothetical protein